MFERIVLLGSYLCKDVIALLLKAGAVRTAVIFLNGTFKYIVTVTLTFLQVRHTLPSVDNTFGRVTEKRYKIENGVSDVDMWKSIMVN
jgi:hypothetical protein